MQNLSSDTEATLLLCGHFQSQQQSDLKPLTPAEYNKLARWLHQNGKRPSDLVNSKSEAFEQDFLNNVVDVQRLKDLVARGAAKALALEAWENVGLWIVGRSEPDYPRILKDRLGNKTPALLYGAGNIKLLGKGGVCIVGSRNVSDEGKVFAKEAATKSANSGYSVISGGARGVDKIAMKAALNAEGTVVGVLADSLLKAAVTKENRRALASGDIVLISPFGADTVFTPGFAMGRNRYLYALSNLAIIVESDTSGGTWKGAQENCRYEWVPAIVRTSGNIPTGNEELIKAGLTPRTLEQLKATEDVNSLLSSMPVIDVPREVTREMPSLIPAESPPPELPREEPAPAGTGSDEIPAVQASIDYFDFFVSKCHQDLEKSDTLREAEIVDTHQLEKSQVKTWLTRAVEEGKLARLSGPIRYIKGIDENEVMKQMIDAVAEKSPTEKQLIETLKVPRVVLKPMIEKALEQGKIIKSTKPVRYKLSSQKSFDSSGWNSESTKHR